MYTICGIMWCAVSVRCGCGCIGLYLSRGVDTDDDDGGREENPGNCSATVSLPCSLIALAVYYWRLVV